MMTFLAIFFLVASVFSAIYAIFSYLDYRSASEKEKRVFASEMVEPIMLSTMVAICLFVFSHILPSGSTETVEIYPRNFDFYGKTINVNGENKMIVGYKRGMFWLNDGTRTSPGYVRNVCHVRKTIERDVAEWVWLWERF